MLYEQVAKDLQIDKNRLDCEIEQQPELVLLISEQCTKLLERRDQAKIDMDEEYARLSVDLRIDGHPSGIKLTEGSIKELITINEMYIAKQSAYISAKTEYDRWRDLQEAVKARGYALQTLAQLWIANYFADISVKGPSTTDATAEMAKRKLAERRDGMGGISHARK